MQIQKLFYHLKPIIPRRAQIFLRRKIVRQRREKFSAVWPVDAKAKTPPVGWQGWPERKQFAVVLTHDVEWDRGQQKCLEVMKVEQQLGFKSSFNFVPERYNVSPEIRHTLVENGFEVGVHGLKHDGKLYHSRKIFEDRAVKINRYLQEWGAAGFRSPAMHHNLDWLHLLNILYDASTFDTDPFEPQSDGVGTAFPFWVPGNGTQKGYVELPYTLAQDFTLFILMQEKGIAIWKKKLDWIAEHGGMVLVNTHPDYMALCGEKLGGETFPICYYRELLDYMKKQYAGQYWHALPKEVAAFVRNEASMNRNRIKETVFV
jgi:hypothetical protein